MSTTYHAQTDSQTEPTNKTLPDCLPNFVNHDQNDSYHLLPLADHVYNNSATKVPGMSPSYPNYGLHPQTRWMKEQEAQNPGAGIYANWSLTIHQKE